MQPLFRPEAVAHAVRRLDGNVLLPSPLSVWVLGGMAVVVLGTAVGLAANATYAKTETVPGRLSPAAGMVRAVAPRGGLVTEILVAQGQLVERAAPLAKLILLDPAEPGSALEAEYVVAAPIGGRVEALPARVGQSVPVGGAVAIVVPADAELVAELFVPSRAAGFIRPGQPLRLKYQAFPFERYGAQDGVVTDISLTVLLPSEAGVPGLPIGEPVFRVLGRLASQELAVYGERVPLRAGMRLTADIVVDQRTLQEWLLDSIYAVGRR